MSWGSQSEIGNASVLEVFPAARPKRFRGEIQLARPAFRCGVLTYTRLYVKRELVSALDSYSRICNWVVT
jgi:hypothetical protein